MNIEINGPGLSDMHFRRQKHFVRRLAMQRGEALRFSLPHSLGGDEIAVPKPNHIVSDNGDT
jgi:hypothetical protein